MHELPRELDPFVDRRRGGQSFAQGPADVTQAGGLSPCGVMGLGGNVHRSHPLPSGGRWSEKGFHRLAAGGYVLAAGGYVLAAGGYVLAAGGYVRIGAMTNTTPRLP